VRKRERGRWNAWRFSDTIPPRIPPPSTRRQRISRSGQVPQSAGNYHRTRSRHEKTGKSTIIIDWASGFRWCPRRRRLRQAKGSQFFAEDFTGVVISNTDLKWDVTQTPHHDEKRDLHTHCGTVDNATGTYTAPATVPTQAPRLFCCPLRLTRLAEHRRPLLLSRQEYYF